jgi:hypothetical protein
MKLKLLTLAAALFVFSANATSLQMENHAQLSALELAQLQLAKKQAELAAHVDAAKVEVANARTEVAKAEARLKLEKALAELVIGADTELTAVETANEARALAVGYLAGI